MTEIKPGYKVQKLLDTHHHEFAYPLPGGGHRCSICGIKDGDPAMTDICINWLTPTRGVIFDLDHYVGVIIKNGVPHRVTEAQDSRALAVLHIMDYQERGDEDALH